MSRFLTKIINEQPGEKKPSLTVVDSPSSMDSQPVLDSLPVEQTPPLPVDRPPKEDSPPTTDSLSNTDIPNLLSTVPDVAGRLWLPHRYTDHLCRWLTPDEQAIYTQLYRLSWGWNKDTCFISNPRLSERSNVPLTTMRRAVGKLVNKGLIEKTGRIFGSNMEQGIEYRVFTLDSLSGMDSQTKKDSLSTVAPNKDKNKKKDSKRDEATPNFQSCTDCHGTGFHYVDELDRGKGVEKCMHKNLKSPPS
ncbi:MAG TPA: replication protein [Pyrinomonadaceae bacterium]|jgi:hypothetical protein